MMHTHPLPIIHLEKATLTHSKVFQVPPFFYPLHCNCSPLSLTSHEKRSETSAERTRGVGENIYLSLYKSVYL